MWINQPSTQKTLSNRFKPKNQDLSTDCSPFFSTVITLYTIKIHYSTYSPLLWKRRVGEDLTIKKTWG
jgi:hypothetical protein